MKAELQLCIHQKHLVATHSRNLGRKKSDLKLWHDIDVGLNVEVKRKNLMIINCGAKPKWENIPWPRFTDDQYVHVIKSMLLREGLVTVSWKYS